MVKFLLIAFISFLPMTTLAFAKDIKAVVAPMEYCSDHYIEVVSSPSGNKIQLAKQWDVLLYEGFDGYVKQERDVSKNAPEGYSNWKYVPTDGWGFYNYRNSLKPSISREKDSQNAYLIVHGSEGDTAFGLVSPEVHIEQNKKYTLSFRCRFNKRMINHSGHKGKYETGIIWFDSNHRKLHEASFSLLPGEADYANWYVKTIAVVSPEKASMAIVRFGFDLPNLGKDEFFCFDDIQFSTVSNRYEHEGEFVSRPFQIKPGTSFITTQADIPEGTAIRLQVRFANDNNGIPGDWSSFTGHDGAPLSCYNSKDTALDISPDTAHKWLQYRAVLRTTKPDTTPALRSVAIKNPNGTIITDNGWSGPDTTPPEIVWRSPMRVEQADAPISFRLCDNTGGLGIKSIEAYLDGVKVELLQGKSKETEYTLKTTGPLKPLERDTGFSDWKIENYQNALAVERSPDTVTFTRNDISEAYVDTAFKFCSPRIPVIENTKYVLSFSSRYNSNLTDIKHWGDVSNGIIWRDRNGKEIGAPHRISFGTAHMKWHRDVQKVTSPSGAVSAEICFGWDSPNLNNGEFFSIKDVCLEGTRSDVTWKPNLHKIEVKACDLAGNTIQKAWYVLIKRIPTQSIVTMREDGMSLIDNKPFFPIGIYAVQKSKVNSDNFENAFKELKDAGFNTTHTYMKERNNDFAEFYSTAARYGMKIFVMTSDGHNSTDIDTMVRDVATEVDQPALLSWYLADDTSGYISSKELMNIHEIIKDIDPYHMTSQADAVGDANRYKGYGDSTDIFLPELYPIRTKGNNNISEVIRDMKNVQEEFERIGSRRGIWAIVQDFKGWGWERYPTDEEVRAMTYLSIIHGATGIMYYTYGGWGNNFGAPYDKDVWSYLKKVVGELASLHDVLAERNTTEKCTSSITKGAGKDGMGYPALNTLLKVYQEKHYLFAANSSQQPIRCQFKPASGNVSEVSVMFEDRTLPVKDGVFVDDFKPYDVHVYQW